MEKSRKFRRSALVTLTITGGLAAAGCCDRTTSPAERSRQTTWWRFWHNESWCSGSGRGHSGAFGYFGGSRGSHAGATARGGFGGAAHGSGGG